MTTPFYVLQVAVPSPLRRLFDYLPPPQCENTHWQPGVRVMVPFGRRQTVVGVVIKVSHTTSVPVGQLKHALSVIDDEALWPPTLFKLLLRASEYYQHPIGEVFHHALPLALRQGKPAVMPTLPAGSAHISRTVSQGPLQATPAQQQAIDAIVSGLNTVQVYLLDGVTGSGKTEVYLQAIAAVLQQNKQALVLVPEISLTPQTVSRFTERFNVPVAVLHSGLKARERLQAWLSARQGECAIVIGTRSALFTPLAHPGIIIVDEEHDVSFKQQEGFRYSARDLAVLRAHLEQIPVVLGSATPALESLQNALAGRYQRLRLPQRTGSARPPTFTLLDMKASHLDEGLSLPLIEKMRQHLVKGNQVLLFLNRRGFAPTVMCHDCGNVVDCKRCDHALTLHQTTGVLRCHHCGSERRILKQCEACGSPDLRPVGIGTERLFAAISRNFPDYSAIRIDRDTVRKKGALAQCLDEVHTGKHHILLGTQMLAKGHHFPKVTLVGIVDIDSGLFSVDFRASERMGQLLTQVAGRAGRSELPGEVVIQTYHPQHPLLIQLLEQGYSAFAEALLKERTAALLPPFSHFALLRAEAVHANRPLAFLRAAKGLAEELAAAGIVCLGPVPAPMERRAGRYRAQLLLQASSRRPLQVLLTALTEILEKHVFARQVRWSIDIDPLEMV